MNKQELSGKTLAILMIQEQNGQDDTHVLGGTVNLINGGLYLDSGPERPPFYIEEAWLKRIKPTPEALKEVLSNAHFYLSLSLGPLPKDNDRNEYQKTGLNLNT